MKTFLKANWENLIMANYEIDPALLIPYLPKGVSLDYYHGKTYISLVGFLFKNTSLFNIPMPLLGTFEEVNLRFYVVRKEGNQIKRGVVFINETVPNKLVAWVANKLYKEHYSAVPTKHQWTINNHQKDIVYQWNVKGVWNNISVVADANHHGMVEGSMEEFIFEHYYGYTRVDENNTLEYKINHPSWNINTVKQYNINCDFATFYGADFGILNQTKPHSVLLAVGSSIRVDWKRIPV